MAHIPPLDMDSHPELQPAFAAPPRPWGLFPTVPVPWLICGNCPLFFLRCSQP